MAPLDVHGLAGSCAGIRPTRLRGSYRDGDRKRSLAHRRVRQHRRGVGRASGGRPRPGRADDPSAHAAPRVAHPRAGGGVSATSSPTSALRVTVRLRRLRRRELRRHSHRSRTVGLVPPETRRERTAELKEIADFAQLLGVDVVGVHLGFVPHDRTSSDYRDVLARHPRRLRSLANERPGPAPRNGPGAGRRAVAISGRRRARQPVRQLRPGQHDPVRLRRADPGAAHARPLRPQHPLQRRHVVRPSPARPGAPKSRSARATSTSQPTSARSQRSATTGPLTIEREIPQEPDPPKSRNRRRRRSP